MADNDPALRQVLSGAHQNQTGNVLHNEDRTARGLCKSRPYVTWAPAHPQTGV